MRVQAILNPRAGLAAQRALSALRDARRSGGPIAVTLTERPGHARELARRAADEAAELVLAVGGDGTMNEVAEGLLGSETALGLVPVGSGNGLARTLRMPLEAARALEALESGVTRRMDVGFVNGRPFLNVAGAGFDAAVGADFHAHGRRGGRRGILPYVGLGLARAFSYRPEAFTLEAGAQGFSGRAFVVAFANGRQYGAGALIAPQARLDDGRLSVVVLEAAPRLELLLAAPRLFTGGVAGSRRYHAFETERATLRADHAFLHHRDGEPEERTRAIEVTLRPAALRVRVPAAVAGDPAGPFSARSEGATAGCGSATPGR